MSLVYDLVFQNILLPKSHARKIEKLTKILNCIKSSCVPKCLNIPIYVLLTKGILTFWSKGVGKFWTGGIETF